MTQGGHARQAAIVAGEPGAAEALEDWITIWQSELAAMVTDRELQEAMLRMIDAWATQARLAARMLGQAFDAANGSARAAAAAGAAAAAAAPDGRDALIRELLDRVTELERRLAELSA